MGVDERNSLHSHINTVITCLLRKRGWTFLYSSISSKTMI